MQRAKLDRGPRAEAERPRNPEAEIAAAVEMRLLAVRQNFFDALPIATAIVHRDRAGMAVTAANGAFLALADVAACNAAAGSPLLGPKALGPAIDDFLNGTERRRSFAWADGTAIGSRHFLVGLSYLDPKREERRRCLLTLVDRTVEVESERSLRSEMLHDSLTGLPNRVAFDEVVENRGAAGVDAAAAVLVVDLRRFSRINESLGPLAGDELLITVARRLLSTLRAGDRLARIGGNEFAILLHVSHGIDDALIAAERLRGALSTPVRLSELEIQIECAIGCALIGAEGDEGVRNAQFALKRAKRSGQIEVYQSGEAISARRRFSLETELRRAIEADALTLAFQPLIDLSSGVLKGFEALARWTHAERGPVPPSEFIPVAEESGLIMPLGRWALDAALRTLGEWDARAGKTLPLHVSVNMSAIQVARDDVAAMAAETLHRRGIAGKRLTLEITESAIFPDPERATAVIEALKTLDVQIAMDDFGTGYSNLAYLQRLPIDVLKIDRSFVTDMLQDRDSVAIVRAVLSLAHALGMTTTAEGIETMELAQTLNALGCTQGQGYYFSRPLPADQAFAYWRARNA